MMADDTILMPELIAESVVQELGYYLHHIHNIELDRKPLIAKLTEKAEKHYAANAEFRRKIKRNVTWGRDWHYVFMRHWLAAELLPLYQDRKIPQQFANGESIAHWVKLEKRA
jgi:hypothetical protein